MVISTDTVEGRSVTYTITETIAEQTETDISAFPPLYETIDPDALDAFLQGSNSTDARPERSVEFSYCTYRVTVDATGRVQLHSTADADQSVSAP